MEMLFVLQKQSHNLTMLERQLHWSAYMPIGEVLWIVSALWHQANDIFTSGYAGIQCAAMALVNIIRAKILPPGRWNASAMDRNMIEDGSIYENIRILSNENPIRNRIDTNRRSINLEVWSQWDSQCSIASSWLKKGLVWVSMSGLRDKKKKDWKIVNSGGVEWGLLTRRLHGKWADLIDVEWQKE